MGARETALNALIACRRDAAWSNGVLKEYIVRDRLDRRDAALAARLCYGVLQNRNRLDFYLKQLLTGKLKDLHPENVEEIAQAIAFLRDNPEEAKRMGENGRRVVKEEFNWGVEEKKLFALYEDILRS